MHSQTPIDINFDDFFDLSLNGYIITDADGKILRMNKKINNWLDFESSFYLGKRISNILAVGGRIYFETHLWPLLSMQGNFDEVAVELLDSRQRKLPVYINAYDRKDENDRSIFKIFTFFKATDRRQFENNLQNAKETAESNLLTEQQNAVVREQFIAVLGHDLRNPLSGIMTGAQVLLRSSLSERDAKLVNVINAGSKRMLEMINNIMDLARGRLGGGISINPIPSDLKILLNQVADELRTSSPEKIIETSFEVNHLVDCDPARIAQLVSNLLANAIMHGSSEPPVLLKAVANEKHWEISVTNGGQQIPPETLKYLFHPFHRENDHSSNSTGLGLGLYIASEIAKAHQAELTVHSDENQTCFTLRKEFLF